MTLKSLATKAKRPAGCCITCWILQELPKGGEDGSEALREALASGASSQSISSELLNLGHAVSAGAIRNHRLRVHA